MKKKPELFKRTGKSSLALRNFLNNLKENDLHYENKQITQCVFLGVLRLKPVPSIFAKNNVPSVSAPVESKSKRIKNNNSNKERNKNVSKKNDINKVLGGKVSKKNPEKVKAAVKKVPPKKPVIKIKLNAKKKTSKVKKTIPSSPNDQHETVTVSPENSQAAVSSGSVLSSPTITLNSIGSPTKFNPVQNLFDKLKQKIDESHSEPGPSTIPKQSNKTVGGLGLSEGSSKVCKINAKRQVNLSVNVNRKSKKGKPVSYERLTMPLKPISPITISDTESTGKKDDIIIIDENNLSSNQEVDKIVAEKVTTEDVIFEDIIFINEDPKPVKHKERTSPRNKTISLTQGKEKTDNFEKHGVIIINDEQKSTTTKHQTPSKLDETLQSSTEAISTDLDETCSQSGDIIIISDEPKTKETTRPASLKKPENAMEKDNSQKVQESRQDSLKNDVIVIEDMRVLRVSPRLKQIENPLGNRKDGEHSKTSLQEQKAANDDVIIVSEETNRIPKINRMQKSREEMHNFSEKAPMDESKTKELNITIDDQQNVNKDKTSPRLLQMVENVRSSSVAVKKELIESNNDADVIIISEKPKPRRNKLKSPSIPPMFLNAPMLLRSELAPKKTTPIRDTPKVTKRREKSTLKLLRSDVEHIKDPKNTSVKLNEKKLNSNITKLQDKSSKHPGSKFCSEKDSENSVLLQSPSQTISTSGNEEVICITDHAKKIKEKSATTKSFENIKRNDVQEIDLVTEVKEHTPDSSRKSDLVQKRTPECSNSDLRKSDHTDLRDDIIVVNEDSTKKQMNSERKSASARLLRSEIAQQKSSKTSTAQSKESEEAILKPRQKSPNNILKLRSGTQKDEDVVIIKDELRPTEKTSPRLLRSDLSKCKSLENIPTNNKKQLSIKNEEEFSKSVISQQTIIIEPEEDNTGNCSNEVEILKPQENSGNRQLRTEVQSAPHPTVVKSVSKIDEDVIIVKEELKPKVNVSPRTLRSDVAQSIKVESSEEKHRDELTQEVLVINNEKSPMQEEKTLSRLLRSENAKQKTKTKSQKNKQVDLNEIVVVNEKRVKKSRERTTSGRLLRSELALQRAREILPVKTEVEEVIVLIHDEPKPKRTYSSRSECSQKNKKISIQEEVIVLTEETQLSKNSSPRSLRSDTNENHSAEKTKIKSSLPEDHIQEETKVGKRISSSRLLRSEMTVSHVLLDLPNDKSKSVAETKIEKQRILRSEDTSKKSPQPITQDAHGSCNIVEREQIQKLTSPSSSFRSVASQYSPENLPKEQCKSPINASIERQKSPRSETANKKKPLAKIQPVSCTTAEKQQIETPSSPSRLLRSVIASQYNPQNLSEESKSPVETKIEKQKLLKSQTLCKKSTPSLPKDQSSICNVAKEKQMKKQASRSLRSIASQHSPQNLPEKSASPEKKNIPKQRLLRSEIISSKCSKNVPLDQSGICDITEDTINQPCSSRLPLPEIVLTGIPENLSKQQSVGFQTTDEPTFPARVLRSEIAAQKSPSNLTKEQFVKIEIIDDANIENPVCSPRLLRSEVSLQKSPLNLQKQQTESFETEGNTKVEKISKSNISKKNLQDIPRKKSEGTEVLCVNKKRKSPLRKSKSLLMDSKIKLKTPMLLRSELAQLKNLDAGTCPNQKQERKRTQSKKGRSKSTPPPINLEIPLQEPTPNVPTSKGKAPKRKSLIDDLKRKKSSKQKEIVMQDVKSSPEIIPKPTKISEVLPETQIQSNEIQNVKIETISETVDSILPSSIENNMDMQENSTENLLKCNGMVEDAKKNVKPMNTEEKSLENPAELPLKRKSKSLDAPKVVKSKMKIIESTTESPPKNPLKRKSKSPGTPKKVKPKLSKKISTTTKLKNTVTSTVAVSSPGEVDPEASIKTSPKQHRKRLSIKRKLKVTKVDAGKTLPERPISNENVPEAAKISITPEKTPPKQVDTTVFDFDETEPEVVPLRLNSPRKNKGLQPSTGDSKELRPSKSNIDITQKPKKQKLMINKINTDVPKTKAQAKAKLLAMLGDKSPQKNNLESPEKPKGKSTKTKSASKNITEKNQSLDEPLSSPKQAENTKRDTRNSTSDKTKTSPQKTVPSPMKQTTITDMFNKVLVKKEKANLVESVFGPAPQKTPPEEPLRENTNENTITEMAPPKAERKINLANKNEEEENGLCDDDDEDSDCESRLEWMPEEYAEYKFKYSAKKMMSYKPIHKCKICLLILPSYYRLSQHKKEHAKKPNPYNCTQCDQAFPSIEDLTAHLRIHKGKHPYTCKKCDIGFWSKKSLDAHTPIHVLRKVKQPNKRFRCDVCAKEFSKLCDMERHTRVHTGEKPCVCNICNKRFQQSHNLSKHLLTHLHVKPYHCEICNKQFGRNDVLNRHLLTHSVDKPIKCPLCPKAFIRQTQLNNHMKKSHPDAAKIGMKAESNVVEAN